MVIDAEFIYGDWMFQSGVSIKRSDRMFLTIDAVAVMLIKRSNAVKVPSVFIENSKHVSTNLPSLLIFENFLEV